jgi:hypothetical protein
MYLSIRGGRLRLLPPFPFPSPFMRFPYYLLDLARLGKLPN